MSTFFSQSYKPQVLSRQEGFHLPTPSPPTPPSTTTGNNNNTNANNGQFQDLTHGLFSAPFLSIPDPFRKFPAPDAHSPLDFSDELASLMSPAPAHQQPQHSSLSSERTTQRSPSAYDDSAYRPPPHNIFDISAPTPHASHAHYGGNGNGGGGGGNAYSLPPASSLHGAHGLDFSHTHFNSTLPALGSSMRYEPAPPNAPAPGEPSSFSSSFSVSTFPDFHPPPAQPHPQSHAAQRTPSPGTPLEDPFASRSRSRSRPPLQHTQNAGQGQQEPPSTHGGPARRTRKRNSVSSTSPPPLHRGHTQPLVIPGTSLARGPASPLGLHATTAPGNVGGAWFLPGPGEFLPTPESVHGGFSAFTGPGSLSQSLSHSYPAPSSYPPPPGPKLSDAQPPVADAPDAASKQALLANEKRRRRRESHNAVERRRRDNINEKISELATLIPECLLDPNATFTMPANLGGSEGEVMWGAGWKEGSPAGAGAGASVNANGTGKEGGPKEAKEGGQKDAREEEKDGSAEPEEKEGPDGAVVKANKGMILRKSVEYIRYLQQLVSAQASRNRELEQRLAALRLSGAPEDDPAQDEGGMMLHEEVDGGAFGFFGFGAGPGAAASTGVASSANGAAASGSGASANVNASGASANANASGHRRRASSAMRRGFSGFELARVDEDEMDVDAGAGSLPSPGPEGEDLEGEAPRGRKGRVGGAVKEEGMEG